MVPILKTGYAIFSSPLRGEVGAQAQGGGVKPFSKSTRLNARKLRKSLTDPEKKLWYFLQKRNLDGFKFRRQQPIGPYIADFICFEARLIIEIDGGQHNEHKAYDTLRDAFLKKEGYRVLRFWNNEIFENTEATLEIILEHLRHPHLTSPLKGEE